ncbi:MULTISPECIES: hypothetical protein [unclassified Mesorhizobium]|uniref:hypothetical protein n=1 Tax=unclassified Mesorhizobium TaxID=325217 RepID=UPI001092199D|nr:MULTISPECIES: hypothetical protein [unclassified Mesorhizobium]TGQ01415.1 hypothetical protein EN861_01480 [Mesorhizobium sp. M8A.F.Ca.ET.218.01.1.1]TGT20688.1 hypothetical protein EN856_01485 [Mesorhizobium sp. M8A.F.Ca.ET.213.01.1.1]
MNANLKMLVAGQRKAMAGLTEGLEAVRAQIRGLKERRAKVEVQPPEIEIALQRVDAWIKPMRGALEIFRAPDFAAADGFRFPSVAGFEGPLALAVVADLASDAMKAKIRTAYETKPGISDQDRKAELLRLDQTLMEAELVEEELIRNATRAGINLLRRADADPRAVLAADAVFASLAN